MRTSRAASTLSKSGSNPDVESGELLELLDFGEWDSTLSDRPIWDLVDTASVPGDSLAFNIFITSLIVRLGFSAEPSPGFFSATTMAR
jgi:hypothetical protein